jgi:hypothetical protein
MNRFLPLVTCLFVGLAATLVSSCARYLVSEPVSHRLWLRHLRLGSPTNPVPLPGSTTGRLSLSNTGITRRPLLTHTTGHRLIHTTGRLQVMMTNTTHPQAVPDTSYLTALPYTGRHPARVERPFRGWSPARRSAAKLITKDEARRICSRRQIVGQTVVCERQKCRDCA